MVLTRRMGAGPMSIDKRRVGFRRLTPLGIMVMLACIILPAPSPAKIHMPLLSGSARQNDQYYGIGIWRLQINTSLFSGEVQCRLYRRDGKVFYKDSAIGFRFDSDADTLHAWIKIEDGAAFRWRDMLPTLAAQRTPVGGRNLTAPTDGIVWLPLSVMGGAQNVTIQLHPDKQPRNFRMEGFTHLLDAGRRLGCAPDARFQP